MLDVSGAIAIAVANLRMEVGNANRVPWVTIIGYDCGFIEYWL